MPTTFGQIVIGPPGAGKTTYCDHMSGLLRSLNRKVAVLNIDPANEGETLPYKGNNSIHRQEFSLGVGIPYTIVLSNR